MLHLIASRVRWLYCYISHKWLSDNVIGDFLTCGFRHRIYEVVVAQILIIICLKTRTHAVFHGCAHNFFVDIAYLNSTIRKHFIKKMDRLSTFHAFFRMIYKMTRNKEINQLYLHDSEIVLVWSNYYMTARSKGDWTIRPALWYAVKNLAYGS